MREDTAIVAVAAMQEAGWPARVGPAKRWPGRWAVRTHGYDRPPCATRWRARQLAYLATGEADPTPDFDTWHAHVVAINGGCACGETNAAGANPP